ncbi:hypothetical protein L1049_015868 [Liquidambar formosana]|uniref:Subtilisin-like protease SBT3.6 n=1 Tax=Liquidambar formosana TaxID=63359 RepID=A0AAP0S5D9_LIQFO
MASSSSCIFATLFLLLVLELSCFVLSLVSTNVYIVYMGDRPHEEPELVQDSHHEILSGLLGSKEAAMDSILYSYKHGFSGFAAVLTHSQAKLIADFPGVVRVVPNRILSLQTTRSWDFLQVWPQLVNGILSKSQSGVGSIIGVLDTGIWPESESFKGEGKHVNKFYPIVYGEDIVSHDSDEDSARSCQSGSLNATLARRKVVLCFQSSTQRSATVATRTVQIAQGVGVIFAQIPTKDVGISWEIPLIQVDFIIGTSLLTYMQATRDQYHAFPSEKKATDCANTTKGQNYKEGWPKSLNMKIVSSYTQHHRFKEASLNDVYGQSVVAEGAPHKKADPFDYGGGHVNPNKAVSPGLIYDLGIADYVRFLCSMGYNETAISLMSRDHKPCYKTTNRLYNLNLPSITIPELKQNLAVSRTVTNVGPAASVYAARVEAPPGIDVRVKPMILSFNYTVKTLKFKVIFRSQLRVQGRFSFGNLFWEDGLHVVRIPLSVRTVIADSYAET